MRAWRVEIGAPYETAEILAVMAFVGVLVLGPVAHADDYNHAPSAPFMDEIVLALIRLPALGLMFNQVLRPVTPPQVEVPSAPTIRFAPTFSASSLGLRAVATF